MAATMAPMTSDRVEHRAATRGLRDNAGIDLREDIEAVADFGAAARRLRASVKGDDITVVAPVTRQDASAIDLDLRKAQLAGRAAQLLASLDTERKADEFAARSVHPTSSERRFARGLRLAR
jgi:hypothetical protein